MSYRIQLADAREARDHLLPIWSANLQLVGPPDAKLSWFYCDGPHGPGRAFLLHAEREPARTTPVGSAGVGVRALRYGDHTLRAALFTDLAVERAHRSGLPALALVGAVKHHVGESFDLGYGFPNAKALAIYRRSGYLQLGEVHRFTRVLRVGAHLAQYIPKSPLTPLVARGVAAVADGALAAATTIRSYGATRRYALVWLDLFDSRFDQLWRESRALAPIACERSAAFLTWRFGRQPGQRCRIAALIDRRTDRLWAYAVVRGVGSSLEIADLFGADLLELDVLLRCLLPALYDLGGATVTFRFLGTPRIGRMLAHHGFTRRPETRVVVLALGERRAPEPRLLDPTAWYLTDLDEAS